jgi:hypothetical protein
MRPLVEKVRNPKSDLYLLLRAKKMSDEKNYDEKNNILRGMLEKYPDEFVIDSDLNSNISGITHLPTSFKIHVPRHIIPTSIKRQAPTMKSANNLSWEDVPEQAVLYADAVRQTYNKVASALLPGTYAWINPYDNRVVVDKSGDVSTCLEKEAIAHDVCQPQDSLNEGPPWIMIKSARDLLMSDVFGPVAQTLMIKPSKFSNAIGGASPLASMLAGGLLSAGLGYGAGALAETIAPRVFERNKTRKRLAALGGILGAIPGLGLGALGMSTWDSKYNPDRGKSSWNAFIQPNVLYGSPKTANPPQSAAGALLASLPKPANNQPAPAPAFNFNQKQYPHLGGLTANRPIEKWFDPYNEDHIRHFYGTSGDYSFMNPENPRQRFSGSAYGTGVPVTPEIPRIKKSTFINKAAECLAAIQPEISAEMQKAADMFGGMAPSISLEPIPVDAFNRLVLNDPFTTAPMQAATLGVVNAASNLGGPSRFVSPMDIARIGMGMGAGYVQAAIGGKVLGALAGVTPEAQRTLQNAGIVAGAIKSVVPGLFGQ